MSSVYAGCPVWSFAAQPLHRNSINTPAKFVRALSCISPTVTLTVRFIPRYVSLRTLAAIPNSSSATLGFASAMGLMLSAASLIQTSLTNKMRLLVPILPVKSSCIAVCIIPVEWEKIWPEKKISCKHKKCLDKKREMLYYIICR